MGIAFAGFMTSLSLIAVIGAQNAFVLRHGIANAHIRLIVTLCSLSDVLLIAVGVHGVGAVIASNPWANTVARYGGAAFLVGYGVLAARRAVRPRAMVVVYQADGSRRAAALACLTITWLNPAVYVDTVVLVGSLAGQYGRHGQWLFGAGAATASVLWFHTLGYGARYLGPLFERPVAWRVLDAVIAVVMLVLAVALVWT